MEEYNKNDTIFVQIASYRDPELQWTLKDLFEKAKRPENIFVGICHQYDMKGDEDKHLFEIPFSHLEQLRIDKVDYRESQGCCWARNRVQKLWNCEKWTLMLDSHMRFERNWDEILVKNIKEQIKLNKTEKIVLVAYLPGFEYERNEKTINNENKVLEETEIKYNKNIGNIKLLFDHDFIRCNGASNYNSFKPIASFSAGFAFTYAKLFLKDIVYDPKLFFLGEEPTIAGRLFTKGWKTIYFNEIIIYHLYNLDKTKIKLERNINVNSENNILSKMRQSQIFNMKKTNNQKVLEDIYKYNLGEERTLRDYERFSGVDFRKKTIREHTKQGVFEEWQETLKIDEIKNIFNNTYSNV